MTPERLQQLQELVTSWLGKDEVPVMVEHPFVADFMKHFGPTVGEIRHLVSQAMAPNRELDPTPITEEFATSLGGAIGLFDFHFRVQLWDGCELIYYRKTKLWRLCRDLNMSFNAPISTIGQFWSCCRIFGVIPTIKESHDRS